MKKNIIIAFLFILAGFGMQGQTILDCSRIIAGKSQELTSSQMPNTLRASKATASAGTLTYQWQNCTNFSSWSWTDVSYGTNSHYYPTYISQTTYYRRKVTLTYNSQVVQTVYSDTAWLYLLPSYDHRPVLNGLTVTDVWKDNVSTCSQVNALIRTERGQIRSCFDGIGRSVQMVVRQGGPSGKDMLLSTSYDEYGRKEKQYLPYTGNDSLGQYVQNAITAQASYYNSPPTTVAGSSVAYSEVKYENSPLGRPTETAAPGTAYAMGNGHTQQSFYQINTGTDVKLWTISGTTLNSSSNYPAATLYKKCRIRYNGRHW